MKLNDQIDLLTGHQAIAGHLGWTLRQTRHRDAAGELPTFRMGAGRTVYARKSTLAQHFASLEAAGAGGQSNG